MTSSAEHLPTPRPHAADPIPAALNAAIVIAITLVQGSIAYALSHSAPSWWWAPALLLCGIVGITTYQAMHEAEHGILFGSSRANDVGGVWLAALFGGPFTFLRACHLGHHARNRTRDECFEIVWHEQDMRVRAPLFYLVFLGGFWLLVPLSCIALAISPPTLRARFVARSKASAMVQGMPTHWMARIQKEAILVVALHAGLLLSGVVTPLAWGLCYGAIALLWSSQNYLGHAHEQSFDVVSGAFNLDVNPLYGALIMNFHWHRAHHQNPLVPWIHLPRHDDATSPHQCYWSAYARFLRGPVTPPPHAPTLAQPRVVSPAR